MFSQRFRLFLGLVVVLAVTVLVVLRKEQSPGVESSSLSKEVISADPANPAAASLATQPESKVTGTSVAQVSEPEKRSPAIADNSVPASTSPTEPAPSSEELAAQWRGLRRDLRWQEPMPEPEMAEFADWTRRYMAAPPAARSGLILEGVQLATARRTALAGMIERDPVRALEVAVPVTVRQQMPHQVSDLLEDDVKGRGDLMVAGQLPLPGVISNVKPIVRTASINGRDYEAFTGPRRTGQPSRVRVPLHGIAIDGKMAVSDWPGRATEPGEVAAAKRALGEDQVCETSGVETTSLNDEAVIDVAGTYRFYCGAAHAMAELQELASQESALPLGYGTGVEASAYTEGTKRILILRVDFPDYQGQRVSDATLTKLVTDNKAFWEAMSYGKTSWAPVGQGGSAITPTLRLPGNSDQYTQLGTILAAARAAAQNAGYVLSDYDFSMIVSAQRPAVGFGGIGYVGFPGCWVANSQWDLGTSSHELGHNFGLNHANSWDTTDNSIIGAGTSTEYGDPYDTMGVAPNESRRHFNSRYKNLLGWLTNSEVRTITASGTYRVFAHDIKDATGIRGLKIVRTGIRNYWVDARQLFADERWISNGVFLHWTGNNNERSDLLDTTPNSTDGKMDAALVLGRTFSDTQYGIHITPVAKITGTPADAYDVVVNLGAFASNRKPTLSVNASVTNANLGQTVTFTANASDADGDGLAYFWEFDDGSFATTLNNSVVTKSWNTASEQLVRCTVSDMKGGIAIGSVVVRVGNPSTYSITGKVSNDVGGVEGVTVSTNGRTTVTNSDGTYALVGLSGGIYTVTAAGPGRNYFPDGFVNPVALPPSKSEINFGITSVAPRMTALPPLMVNLNTTIGPMAFTVDDKDTPLSALKFSVTSDNINLVAPKDVVFSGSDVNRTVSVTPGTNQTGTAKLQIRCYDPENNEAVREWVITVNAPPAITLGTLRTSEDTGFEFDARTMVDDAQTADADLLFTVGGSSQGTATLLPDGHTVRFVPVANFNGTASFQLSATDQSSEPRLFLYYSFEGPDDLSDGKAMDRSNFGRDGQLNVVGGGELTFADGDVPPALALYEKTTLQLVENNDETTSGNAARITRDIPASELNFSNQPWTFACWFQRQGSQSDDLILHIGDGAVSGTTDQLEILCPAGTSNVVLRHLILSGTNFEATNLFLSAPLSSETGPWHHVAVTFQPTGPGVGTFEFYVDGTKAGSTAGVTVGMSQSVPVVFGGHNVETTRLDRWFNGKLDEIALWNTALTSDELARVSRMIVSHFSGVTRTAQVNVSVTAVNDAPAIAVIGNQTMNEDATLGPLPVTVSDDTTPASSLALRATSSNPGLIPPSALIFGGNGSARTLTIKPVPDGAGTATITIFAGDGTLEGATEFTLTVQQVNDGPTISSFSDVSLPEDGSAVLLPFEISDRDNAPDSLLVSATSSNPALVSDANLGIEGVGTRRALRVTPQLNASGTATITVTVTDGALSASQSFNVSVKAANDAPTISAIPNQTTPVGTAVGPVSFEINDAETSPDSLAITVKSTNPKLLPDSAIVRGGSGTQRTLTLTPVSGQTGVAAVTIFVSDGTLKTARTFSLVVEGQGNLQVLVQGEGSVSPGFLGRSQRDVGTSYTVVATPKPGYVFTGWSGGQSSESPKLTFVMPDTLELQANFSPSPFPALRGVWNGLVQDNPATHEGSGLISAKVATNGTFTGTLTYGGVRSAFKGAIRNDGSTAPITVARKGLSPLSVVLQFAGEAGAEKLGGTVADGTRTSVISGDHALFTAAKSPVAPLVNVPAAWLGKYTVAIEPPSLESPVLGAGYAAVTVLPTGVVRAVGKFADGTPFTYSNTLSIGGRLPVYITAYKNAGSLAGSIQWQFKAETDCDGSVFWFKPASAGGWTGGVECLVSGSYYTTPASARGTQAAVPPLPALLNPGVGNSFNVVLTAPASATVQQTVNLSMDGKFTIPSLSSNPVQLQLKLTPATGVLGGSFVIPGSGERRQIGGVLLQKTNRAAGFHVGGSAAGGFDLALPN